MDSHIIYTFAYSTRYHKNYYSNILTVTHMHKVTHEQVQNMT